MWGWWITSDFVCLIKPIFPSLLMGKIAGYRRFFFLCLNLKNSILFLHGFWWERHCSSCPSSSIGKLFLAALVSLKDFVFALVFLQFKYSISRYRYSWYLFYLMFSELPGSVIWCLSLILGNSQPLFSPSLNATFSNISSNPCCMLTLFLHFHETGRLEGLEQEECPVLHLGKGSGKVFSAGE